MANLDNEPERNQEKELLPEKPRIVVFLVICMLLVYGLFIVRQFKDHHFARYDPGWMVSTVMSIVEDRDLDLRNQLQNNPGLAADQTSLGKNGQWYPLHEFLMPIVTVPFYVVFGINGCLIFNVVISILLMILLFELCIRHLDYHSSFIATVLTAFPTLFLDYTYSYSLDVFSAFLLTLAFWCLVKNRFMLTGFVCGLATYARLANAVTILGFVLYILLETTSNASGCSVARGPRTVFKRISPVFSYLAGGLPVALCFLMTNWLMFGSPTITSYDRWQRFVDGQSIVSSQRADFGCSISESLPKTLLDPKSGLVIGAPLLLLAIAFGMRPFWRKAYREAVFLIVTSGSLIILFSKYCNVVPGEPGNRYLMPVVALCAVPLGFAVADCFKRSGESSVPQGR